MRLGFGVNWVAQPSEAVDLDEQEAFDSLVAGLFDAIASGDIPDALKTISLVETNPGRAERLVAYLSELFPGDAASTEASRGSQGSSHSKERLRAAGYASEAKEHVFVAMPFAEEMSDLYHYGIRGAVHAAGYLCERADLSAFTGQIVQRVRDRISNAALVIADLQVPIPTYILRLAMPGDGE